VKFDGIVTSLPLNYLKQQAPNFRYPIGDWGLAVFFLGDGSEPSRIRTQVYAHAEGDKKMEVIA